MTTAVHNPSRACYLRGCRRDDCKQANYRYMSRYRLDRERTGTRRVSSAPTAAHVRVLMAAGWSARQIADATPCAERTIVSLNLGDYATIRGDIAARILATQPTIAGASSKSYVDATGTVRRVRALMAIGHPLYAIAAASHVHRAPLGKIVNHDRSRVTARLARDVAAAYTALSKLPGTNIRARNYAHKNGWHGPLAWDDIDDPNCKPESERNRRKPGARKKSAVDPARVAELTDLGHSAAEIAFQLGCHVRTVTRARGRVLTEVAA